MTEEMALMMSAFRELSTTRSRQMCDAGMIVGPIPWDKMAAYLEHMGFDEVNAEFSGYVLRKLDNEYLALERKRLNDEAKKRELKMKRAARGR